MIPNIMKLNRIAMKKALAYLAKEHGMEKYQLIETEIRVWRQLWGDTSCGCAKRGEIVGNAMTYGYMTMVGVYVTHDNKVDNVYVIFYNGDPKKGFIGTEDELKEVFFDDLKNFQIAPLYEALEKY